MSELMIRHIDRPILSDEAYQRVFAVATDDDDREEIQDMLSSAARVARPAFAWRVSSVEKSEHGVRIDGRLFDNPHVAHKLDGLYRCFPSVQTCGPEVEEWSLAYKGDPLAEYWADMIKREYLSVASRAFLAYLRGIMPSSPHIAAVNPGSLPVWPITAQADLFALLGRDAIEKEAGVRLTPSMLMLPAKSISGIWFESDTAYQNCSFCPRDSCPNRRAPFSGKTVT